LQGMLSEKQNGKCNWSCVVSVFWMLMLNLTAHVHSADAAVNMRAAPSTRASSKPFDGLLIEGKVGRRETRWVGLTEICPLSFVPLQMLFCLTHYTGPAAGVSHAAALPPPPIMISTTWAEGNVMEAARRWAIVMCMFAIKTLLKDIYYLTLLWCCAQRHQEQAKAQGYMLQEAIFGTVSIYIIQYWANVYHIWFANESVAIAVETKLKSKEI
jgi:hypothetical protein